MGRTCTVCSSQSRDAIELAVLQGSSNRAVARQYGVGRDSLARHMKAGHIPLAIVATAEQKQDRHIASLYERAEFLWARSRAILDGAEGRPNIELAAVRELRACVELLSKMTGALDIAEGGELLVELSFPDSPTSPSTEMITGRAIPAQPIVDTPEGGDGA